MYWIQFSLCIVHPNVKLFINHGGISGVYESLDAGVPVLGFPFYNDQHRNIDNLVNAGIAISMNLLSVTEDTLLTAILEIVNNDRWAILAPSMKRKKWHRIRMLNAGTRKTLKSFPNGSKTDLCQLQNLWFTGQSTFYVIKEHLKSHALDLTWYQYFLVDVISTFLFIAFVVLFIIYYSLKIIFKQTHKFFHSFKEKRE